MSALKRFARWLWDYWYIPLTFLAGGVGFLAALALRRTVTPGIPRPSPMAAVRRELGVIRAGTEAEVAAAELGTEEVIRAIHERHREELDKADAWSRKKAERLQRDPRALARHLERLGSGG